jgi:hypothetical protein
VLFAEVEVPDSSVTFVVVVAHAKSPVDVEGVPILSLLPDPVGNDQGREQVTLRNTGTAATNLSGWRLRDRAQNEFMLSGTVAAGATVTITMATFSMPLNNSGDEVQVVDPSGVVRHQVRYEAAQVQPGVTLAFQ